MFRRLQTIGLLAAALALGGTWAEAQTRGVGPERALAGVIVRIDRGARVIIVRDLATNREVTVRVPEGRRIRLRQGSAPSYRTGAVLIEHAMTGMQVDLTVQDVEASAP